MPKEERVQHSSASLGAPRRGLGLAIFGAFFRAADQQTAAILQLYVM